MTEISRCLWQGGRFVLKRLLTDRRVRFASWHDNKGQLVSVAHCRLILLASSEEQFSAVTACCRCGLVKTTMQECGMPATGHHLIYQYAIDLPQYIYNDNHHSVQQHRQKKRTLGFAIHVQLQTASARVGTLTYHGVQKPLDKGNGDIIPTPSFASPGPHTRVGVYDSQASLAASQAYNPQASLHCSRCRVQMPVALMAVVFCGRMACSLHTH